MLAYIDDLQARLGSRITAIGDDGRLIGNGICLGVAAVPGHKLPRPCILLDNGKIAFTPTIRVTPDNPSPPIVVEVTESTRFFLEHEDGLIGFGRLRKGEKIALRDLR